MDGKRMKRPLLWRSVAAMLGGIAGFAYYHYIGCSSGTCPITGNPWISTMYGALIGWLAMSSLRRPQKNSEEIIK